MALPIPIPAPAQAQTDYSTNTATTSHVFTITGSNLTIRNSLVAIFSYDGTGNNIITGITDTDGNTWAKATADTSTGTTHGETWYCTNLPGGTTPTVTVVTSAAVKMTATVEEITGIISYRPGAEVEATSVRIHAPAIAGLSRSTLSTGARSAAASVIITAAAANATSLTFTNGGAGFNGTDGNFHTHKDGTSGLSVAIAHRNAEVLTIGGVTGNMVISPSSTTPVAMMCVTFYRQGVSTGVAGDGALGNIEGVVIEDNSAGNGLVLKSSASAPYGGTGGSTDSKVYGFIPGLDLPAGVTVSDAQLNWNIIEGFSDGLSQGYHVAIDPTAPIGTTLETTDENGVGGSVVVNGSMDESVGFKTATLSPSDVSTSATYMNIMYYVETAEVTGSYWKVGLRADNTPNFVVALLIWPSTSTRRTKPLHLTPAPRLAHPGVH